MKSVNIGELKDRLSGYLEYVRSGEEVVVCNRNVPVARILPMPKGLALSEQEGRLVASGALSLPEKAMDWDEFFALAGRANVPTEVAMKAVIDGRGDR